MSSVSEAEAALLQYLDDRRTVTMDDAIQHFHHFTFNRIFSAVDRLSREGKIRLVRQPSFEYRISVVDSNPTDRQPREGRTHASRYKARTPTGMLSAR